MWIIISVDLVYVAYWIIFACSWQLVVRPNSNIVKRCTPSLSLPKKSLPVSWLKTSGLPWDKKIKFARTFHPANAILDYRSVGEYAQYLLDFIIIAGVWPGFKLNWECFEFSYGVRFEAVIFLIDYEGLLITVDILLSFSITIQYYFSLLSSYIFFKDFMRNGRISRTIKIQIIFVKDHFI